MGMKDRVLIGELEKHVDERVGIAGWVDTRRDHGKLIFLDIRDRSGKVQTVVRQDNATAFVAVEKLHPESTVRIEGTVSKRPEKMIGKGMNGTIELAIETVTILSEAAELPFERETKLNLDTYLDHLPLTLRTERARDIFKVQESVIEAFRTELKSQGFTEFQAPALAGGDAEGGAAAFVVNYYYDQKAYLATSPQFYKQIMVGVYERVFATPKVFRGEKHATSRHLSEYSSLDFEMGFIEDHRTVMDMVERFVRRIVSTIEEKHPDTLARFSAELPLLSSEIPSLKLREAQELIYKETKRDIREEPDLSPEDERWISEWAKREKGSDFLFVTHYPIEKRPFYTYEDEMDPGYTKSFDLLFRGLEITTGGQRRHLYDDLVAAIEKRGLDPKQFSFYLEAFKYGMPPHGGSATGLERITARLLEIPNIKEAALFPRDLNRIDTLIHDGGENT